MDVAGEIGPVEALFEQRPKAYSCLSISSKSASRRASRPALPVIADEPRSGAPKSIVEPDPCDGFRHSASLQPE
jgi:hypothetical protein